MNNSPFNPSEYLAREQRRIARLMRAASGTMRAHVCSPSWSPAEIEARLQEWVTEALDARRERLSGASA
jgi:hypothetical protein